MSKRVSVPPDQRYYGNKRVNIILIKNVSTFVTWMVIIARTIFEYKLQFFSFD